jgi:hypothetical protein
VPEQKRAPANHEEPPNSPSQTEARWEGPGGALPAPPAGGGSLGDDDLEDFEDLEEEPEPTETVDELGRRHVRRPAPEGTEQIIENEAPRETGLPDSIERWRKRSATGTVLTAFALGLQQVFEPEREQPPIIMETSGEPPQDLPVEAQLEQLGPRQSSVRVRPWLLGAGPAEPGASQAPGNPPEAGPGQAVETRADRGEAERDPSDYWPDGTAQANEYWPEEGATRAPDETGRRAPDEGGRRAGKDG